MYSIQQTMTFQKISKIYHFDQNEKEYDPKIFCVSVTKMIQRCCEVWKTPGQRREMNMKRHIDLSN